MITQTVSCPSCKTRITVQGNPGERIYITCPQCLIKGTFIFPEEKLITKTTVNAIETKNLTKFYGKNKGIRESNLFSKKG